MVPFLLAVYFLAAIYAMTRVDNAGHHWEAGFIAVAAIAVPALVAFVGSR